MIYGTCDGFVYTRGYSKSYGNYVVVKSGESGLFHWFCHLSQIKVKQGQTVNRATIIGIMGRTGNATGIHLHFEIRKVCNEYGQNVNPADYMGIPNKIGVYNTENYQIEDYKIGERVNVKIKFTGAERTGEKLIEINKKQFWVFASSVSKDNTSMSVYVNWVEENRLQVNCDAVEDANIQFWVEKSEVVK